MSEFRTFTGAVRTVRKAIDDPADEKSSPTLVYWKDETGEHSFVTEQKLITT